MEKDSRLLGADELPTRQSDEVHPRRSKRTNHAIVVVLLFFVATFWITTVRPAFTIGRHGCRSKLTVEQRAARILQKHPLIDGHNDLMIFIRGKYQNHVYNNEFQEKFENGGLAQHVDIPRLEKGLQGGAFWSAFYVCPSGSNTTDFSDDRYSGIVKATLDQLDLYKRLADSYPKYFTPLSNSHEAVKAFEDGRLISPAAIEGLHQIGNSVSNLRLYHQLGVRYATLTWNCHNKYADAALETEHNYDARIATPYWKGLSPAGRDLVKEMNRLGMLVDLAHVSTDTMRDVLVGKGDEDWKGSLAPPIFSHSSAHAICPHPRNVPDDILHLVKKRNSVVMVNFNADFIACVPSNSSSSLPETVPANATMNQVVRHIKHIGELIGYDHVGIGTDYDGIEATPAGLEDVSKFPDLIAELLRQGISDRDAAKIAGGNILRVWKDADEVAKKLQKHMLPLEDDIKNPWL
ncbi:hypothetical protein EJ07DRAFT_165380 [Lizonia empirigonia]|nr:hypothetical protein EJ07DRAFT_165380 [Lizonia empirigonia]